MRSVSLSGVSSTVRGSSRGDDPDGVPVVDGVQSRAGRSDLEGGRRVMTRASLRSLPAYELGREHERERVSDFHRRMLSGDERDAYLLGRMEERNEQARRSRKQVSA